MWKYLLSVDTDTPVQLLYIVLSSLFASNIPNMLLRPGLHIVCTSARFYTTDTRYSKVLTSDSGNGTGHWAGFPGFYCLVNQQTDKQSCEQAAEHYSHSFIFTFHAKRNRKTGAKQAVAYIHKLKIEKLKSSSASWYNYGPNSHR